MPTLTMARLGYTYSDYTYYGQVALQPYHIDIYVALQLHHVHIQVALQPYHMHICIYAYIGGAAALPARARREGHQLEA